jgi:hypothetical protein
VFILCSSKIVEYFQLLCKQFYPSSKYKREEMKIK